MGGEPRGTVDARFASGLVAETGDLCRNSLTAEGSTKMQQIQQIQMCGVRGSHIWLGTGVTRRMAEGRNSQGSQLSLIGLAPEVEVV